MAKSGLRKPLTRIKILRLALFAIFSILILVYIIFSVIGGNWLTTVQYRKLGVDTPATLGMPYENVSFASADKDKLTLRGWWIPATGSNRTLILVHGRGGNRSAMLSLTRPLWERGFNLLVFDMRGHGESDGDHYSFGQHEQWDVVGAAEYVKSKGFTPGKIGVIGWSMGASSSIMALSDTPDIKAVVSDSAYADYTGLSEWKFNTITGLPSLFYPGALVYDRLFQDLDLNQARPDHTIGNTGGKHIFLIHGTGDTVVPLTEFEKLKQAGKENVSETWVLQGPGHLEAFPSQPEEYIRRVTTFFDKELT